MTTQEWAEFIQTGDRRSLSRAITLLESRKEEDRKQSSLLMRHVLGARTGSQQASQPSGTVANDHYALRIGISGAPGVGKSTYIEALGMYLLSLGHKVAVLAIDPSSNISGGSILGDKTRMERLSVEKNAFIRPSPTGKTLGGVTHTTQSAIALCEWAGYSVVLIETVGVGQNEGAVANMVDCFVLLNQPGSGDELQGIKKGILEYADILLVNKHDGKTKELAEHTLAHLQSASHLYRHELKDYSVPCILISALESIGIEESWNQILGFIDHSKELGFWEKRRNEQIFRWFKQLAEHYWVHQLWQDPNNIAKLASLEKKLRSEKINVIEAVDSFLPPWS